MSVEDWTVVNGGAKKKRPVGFGRPTTPIEPWVYGGSYFYNNPNESSNKRMYQPNYTSTYSGSYPEGGYSYTSKKPCDKYNLEGECRWHDHCKYSHRNLTPEDWSQYYPGIPYILKTNVQKRLQMEHKIYELESKIRILEFKQEGALKDLKEEIRGLRETLKTGASTKTAEL